MLENIISKKAIPADGVQRQWDIPFTFYKLADVGFYVSYDKGKTVEKITQNIRYEKDGNYFVYPTEESKLPVLPVGATVLLLRETENKQFATSETFPFNSRDIEHMADNLTMQIQDLKRDSIRAVKTSLFTDESPEQFTERIFNAASDAAKSAAQAEASASNAKDSENISSANAEESRLNAQNAASSAVLAASASESAREHANAAKNDADRAEAAKVNNEEVLAAAEAFATRSETASEESKKYSEDAKQSVADAEQFAISAAASAESAKNSADLAEELIKDLDAGVYTKEEIDNKVIVIEADIDANADAIQKTRSDFMESDSELQQQINAHAEELTTQKNDIDELGDQVSEIESKIPAAANATNQLADKAYVDSAVAAGGGASVPDNVYTQDNLIAGKNVTFTEVPPEGGIDEHTIAVWHFDGNTNWVDDRGVEYPSDFTYQNVNLNSTYSKFGNGSVSGPNYAGAWIDPATLQSNYGMKRANRNESFTIDWWSLWVSASSGSYYTSKMGFVGSNYGFEIEEDIRYIANVENKINIRTAGVQQSAKFDATAFGAEYGKWVHKALEYDCSGDTAVARLYINGHIAATIEGIEKSATEMGTFQFGYGATEYFDEVRISKIARYKGVDFSDSLPTKSYTVATGPSKTAVNAIVPEVDIPEGIYTKNNLLGGKDIEIVPEPVEGGIDEYTLAVFHYDDTNFPTKNAVEGGENPNITKGIWTDLYKFGTGCSSAGLGVLTTLGEEDDWTVDGWYRFTSNSARLSQGINIRTSEEANLGTLGVFFYSKKIYIYKKRTELKNLDYAWPLNEWIHVATEKHGETINCYVNGAKVISYTGSEVKNSDSNRYLYSRGLSDATREDELRLSKIARYKGENFTPPTEAYRVAEPTGNMVVNFIGESGGAFDFQGTEAEFNAAVEAGKITDDTVSLVTDDDSGELVATKAELAAVDRSKADTALSNVLANIDYVVESKFPTADDTTWYRKYKSGWVEQGGQVLSLNNGAATSAVTFPISFVDTNYTLTFGAFGTGFNAGEANFRCTAYSETGATFYNNSGTAITYKWYACGQGA